MEIKIIIGGTPVQPTGDEGCPVETKDKAKNEENKLRATEEYNYGPPTDPEAICGNCSAYNMSSRILDCLGTDSDNVGFCETHRFSKRCQLAAPLPAASRAHASHPRDIDAINNTAALVQTTD